MLVDKVDHSLSKSEKWKERLMMHSFTKVEDDYYFAALNYNGLYKYNYHENRLVFLGCIPGESISASHLYSKIVHLDGILYMAPMNAKEIALYDIKEDAFHKISLRNEQYRDVPQKFFGAIVYGNKIFMIPARYESVAVIENGQDTISYLDGWKEKFRTLDLGGELWVKNGYFIYDNYLYMALMTTNKIVKINLETYEESIISIDCINDGFVDAVKDDVQDVIWLVGAHSTVVVRYEVGTGDYKIINIGKVCGSIGKYPFISILQDDNYLYIVAYQTDTSVSVDKYTLEPNEVDFEGVCEDSDLNTWGAKHYFGTKISANCYVVSNIDDHSIAIIKNGVICERKYLCNKERDMQLLMKEEYPFIRESNKNTIIDFIRCI